jgi:hypothetical protein
MTSPGERRDMGWPLTTHDHPSSPTDNRTPRSASIGCVADRRAGELRGREPEGSAGTPESLDRETTSDETHRATALLTSEMGDH